MMIDWQKTLINSFVKPTTNLEIIQPEKEYTLLGMSLEGRGLFIREKKKGSEISSKSLNKVIPGRFIYSRLFAWKGAFDYVRSEFKDTYVSNEYPTFSINENIADIKFLYYYFNQIKVWKEVEQYCVGVTKASRNRFKEEYFLNLSVPLPSLATQKLIVTRLESMQNKGELIKKHISEQEKEIQQLLYSKYLEISEPSCLLPMKEVAPIIRRPVEIIEHKDYPELGIRCFGKGTFHKPSITGVEVGTKKIFQIKSGDLLFSNVFAWEGAIAVAQDNDEDRYGSHRFISCVVDKEKMLPEFLCYHFLTYKGLEIINSCSPGGAGRNKTLGLEKLMNIDVPVPDINEQYEFVSLLNKMNKIRELHKKQNDEIKELLSSSLDKAFKGEL